MATKSSQVHKKEATFFEDVYNLVRRIPYGRISSYGIIARCLGSGCSARVVGWALNKSHGVEPFVPAHRVVNRTGLLTGKNHFETTSAMEERLKAEGIAVKDNKIVDFDALLWNPMQESEDGLKTEDFL